jgi:hypothetical protein
MDGLCAETLATDGNCWGSLTPFRATWWHGNTKELYSGGTRFDIGRDIAYPDCGYSWFSSVSLCIAPVYHPNIRGHTV